jgi:ABC-type uncharacterized transport system involved in gliding motility auxiliary subunit
MTGVAALLMGLGTVALGFAFLTAIVALVQPVFDPKWILGNLVVGVALLGAAAFMSLDTLRERMQSGATRRAGRYGTSAILGAVFGIAILCLLAFLSVRHAHRFDVSEASVHTLSQQTKDLLASLDRDVQITAFFAESEAPPVRDLLDRYAFEAQDKVEVAFVEPNDAPGMIEELGLTTDDLAQGIVRISLASGEATTVKELTEPALTNALQKLVKSKDKKIYFLEGHNERTIEPGPEDQAQTIPGQPPAPKSPWATGPDTFGRAADALVNETYHVEPLLLASLADVPEDASVVIVAGPTRPFLEGELAALRRYVERGGGLFVAIDPRAQTNLYSVLDGFGIHLGDDVVVDRRLAVIGQATTPIAQDYDPSHPITKLLHDPTLFPMVRSVELDPAVAGSFSVLVKTGEESWAERDLDVWRETGRAELGASDLVGPVAIAVAGSPASAAAKEPAAADLASPDASAPKPGRLVVFGDSDFATNEYLDALHDRDLFLNAVNWLAGEVESITIRPNTSRASTFEMSQDEFRFLQYVALLVLPEAIAIVGVLVWWSRRR